MKRDEMDVVASVTNELQQYSKRCTHTPVFSLSVCDDASRQVNDFNTDGATT